MIVRNQCVRCGRFPVLDLHALATSLEKHIGNGVELRAAAIEAAKDLTCHSEVCPRAPRRTFQEVPLP